MITIYTDGASRGNPGNGGYGVVIISAKHNLRKEISEGFRITTNNRMELLAVIIAIEALKGEGKNATIYTDSSYIVNSIEKGWLWSWVKKGFKGKKNEDLWRKFIPVYKRHKIKFQWVKGHAGIPENERCDFLATEAAQQPDLQADKGYEAEN